MNQPTSAGEAHTDSYYAATSHPQTSFAALEGELEVDVCVIGAGFTGIASALTLAERGYSVAVLEQHRVGWGASGRNGGQMIGGISGEEEIARQLGPSVADQVWDIGYRGHEIIEERIDRYKIDCDLRHGYIDVAFKDRHMREFETHYAELQRRGFGDQVELVDAGQIQSVVGSEAYIGGLINRRNGHLHPLNLCIGEAEAAASLGVQIFEASPVESIEYGEPVIARTALGQVRAKSLILTGNAYNRLERGRLRGQVFPAGSYIIATEPLTESEVADINPQNLAVCDPNYVLDYFRLSADRRLLFGGRCNYSGRVPASISASIRPRMLKIYPQLEDKRIDYEWGGNIGIVVNRVPLLGRIESNVFYAMGYSGHGVNATHVAGEIMADAVEGRYQRLELFETISHMKIPFGQRFGSQMVALGMLYYRMKDLL